MNRTNITKMKTDAAWERLHHRLEEDQLLPATLSSSSRRKTPLLKWVTATAATIIICISITATLWHTWENPEKQNWITQENLEPSTLVTTFEDGSIVYLAGQTSVKYPEHFAQKRREVSLQGNALFDVTGNRSRPFSIDTEKVRIEVLGTAFNVKCSEKVPFELSVQRGKVKVMLKSGEQAVYVNAGETVTLLKQELQLMKNKDNEQFAHYIRQMRFKDESLDNILRVINSHCSDIQIQASPQIARKRLTVALSNLSPEDVSELLCQAFQLKSVRDGSIIRLSE